MSTQVRAGTATGEGGGGHVLAGTSGVAFGGPGCILGFAKGMRGEHLTQYAKEVKS